MESTGQRGRTQVSCETADLIIAAGKSHWLRRRDEQVVAKGKGEMETFWLNLEVESAASVSSGDSVVEKMAKDVDTTTPVDLASSGLERKFTTAENESNI